jgi:hypothetical protein
VIAREKPKSSSCPSTSKSEVNLKQKCVSGRIKIFGLVPTVDHLQRRNGTIHHTHPITIVVQRENQIRLPGGRFHPFRVACSEGMSDRYEPRQIQGSSASSCNSRTNNNIRTSKKTKSTSINPTLLVSKQCFDGSVRRIL